MDGMSVFGFGLSMGPKSVNNLCEHFEIDKDKIDYFLFHQANRYMNDKIRKKLKIDEAKVPYSMQNFGNTSCASIPLTLVSQCNEDILQKDSTVSLVLLELVLHGGVFILRQITLCVLD